MDYYKLPVNARTNIISFLDPLSRFRLESANRVVQADVHSVYLAELPSTVRSAFKCLIEDDLGAGEPDTDGKAPLKRGRHSENPKSHRQYSEDSLPVPTALIEASTSGDVCDPTLGSSTPSPPQAWRYVNPAVAAMSRNELQRIRQWWVAIHLTSHPMVVRAYPHAAPARKTTKAGSLSKPKAAPVSHSDGSVSDPALDCPQLLTRCSVCLQLADDVKRTPSCPYLLLCTDCSDTRVFSREALTEVWKFTPAQIDESFPYIEAPVQTVGAPGVSAVLGRPILSLSQARNANVQTPQSHASVPSPVPTSPASPFGSANGPLYHQQALHQHMPLLSQHHMTASHGSSGSTTSSGASGSVSDSSMPSLPGSMPSPFTPTHTPLHTPVMQTRQGLSGHNSGHSSGYSSGSGSDTPIGMGVGMGLGMGAYTPNIGAGMTSTHNHSHFPLSPHRPHTPDHGHQSSSSLPLLTAPQLTQSPSDMLLPSVFGHTNEATSAASAGDLRPGPLSNMVSALFPPSAPPSHPYGAPSVFADAPVSFASPPRFVAHAGPTGGPSFGSVPLPLLSPSASTTDMNPGHRMLSMPGVGAGLGLDVLTVDNTLLPDYSYSQQASSVYSQHGTGSLPVQSLATPMPSLTAPAMRMDDEDEDDVAYGMAAGHGHSKGLGKGLGVRDSSLRMSLERDSASLLAAGAQHGFMRDTSASTSASAPAPASASDPAHSGPCHFQHFRELATVPPHTAGQRVYLAWDLVPLRLLSPLYIPRGQHHQQPVAPTPAPARTMAPSTAAQVPAKYRKRRLFGAARISVLKALERAGEEVDTPAATSPAAGTTDASAPRPRGAQQLQSRVDAYAALPLMIYRRYVQCACGRTGRCAESHAHWEEAGDVWPAGASMPQLEMGMLRAHRLEQLVTVCQSDESAPHTGAAPAKALSCRFVLPGPFEPLVQAPGNATNTPPVDGAPGPGVAAADAQVPTLVAAARGLARVRRLERAAMVSPPVSPAVEDASVRRNRLMAKFPVQESADTDTAAAPEDCSGNIQLPQWASDPAAVAAFIAAAPPAWIDPTKDLDMVVEFLSSAAATGRTVGPCPVVLGMMATMSSLNVEVDQKHQDSPCPDRATVPHAG